MKLKKKLLFVLLSLSLVFQSVSPIFAEQSYKSGLYDELLNDNQSSLVVESDGHKDEITVEEDEYYRTVTVTNLSNGEIEQIKINKEENTIYSSYTNEEMDLNLLEDQNIAESIILSNSAYDSPLELCSFKSSSPTNGAWKPGKTKVSYETVYISYAQIKKISGKTVTVSSVIACILAIIPGTQGIGAYLAFINSVVIAVANNKNPSSKHGIKLRVRTLKKLGKNGYYYNISRNIVSWSKY